MYAVEEALHAGMRTSVVAVLSYRVRRKIRTLMTPKLANLRTSIPRLRTSWSCIHSKTVFPGLIREYR
jgi:hypothetical protein